MTDVQPAQPSTPQPTKTLANYVAEIRDAHDGVMDALASGALAAICAGKLLIKARRLVKHGDWQDFLAMECGLRIRTAQIYMYLARHKDKLNQLITAKAQGNSLLTQGEALRLLSSANKRPARPKAKKPEASAKD